MSPNVVSADGVAGFTFAVLFKLLRRFAHSSNVDFGPVENALDFKMRSAFRHVNRSFGYVNEDGSVTKLGLYTKGTIICHMSFKDALGWLGAHAILTATVRHIVVNQPAPFFKPGSLGTRET